MPKPRTTKPATEPEPGSPLAYCLAVMRDKAASPARRDRMAVAAIAYLHQRVVETGIKAVRQDQAMQAGKAARLGRSKVPTK